ncbi:RDD family protein [Aquisalimonas sp.]|uniref:RDD family protein n=1 Tax=unclassified Aquisalimonas TaxID=2644645 RepID=UPI0025C5FAB7|nr:RDD family protein [Aquisalimonas sp.]
MTASATAPSLLRRLASLTYDSMLVLAIIMAATALLLPITGGEALDGLGPQTVLYQAYLLLVVFGFFAICWTRGGQTLGMRSWRLRVLRADGRPVTLRDAALRYGAAVMAWLPLFLIYLWSFTAGLAAIVWLPLLGVFLWSLGGRRRPAWHDLLAGTQLIHELADSR